MAQPKLDGLHFPLTSLDDQNWLERDFEEKEVDRALAKSDNDRAPGLNGFNFRFIKAR